MLRSAFVGAAPVRGLFAALLISLLALPGSFWSAVAAAEAPIITPPATEVLPLPPAVSIPPAALPSNQVWLISTRRAWCHNGHSARLDYWHYESGCWRPSTKEKFLAQDNPAVPTCFFVHGNRIGFNESSYNGWRAYRNLARQAPPERPFRFVIWSWPSSQIKGQLRDVRAKAWRSDSEAFHLAWFVDQMAEDVPVSLLGYSYGARIVTGGLHVLGGGRSAGRGLAVRAHPKRSPVRAVLMAAALDSYWLAPGSRHGLALSQVDQMLIFKNPADKVLRRYHLLYGLRRGPTALGTTGMAGWNHLGSDRAKVAHMNVSGWVGSAHDWTCYLDSPSLVTRMRPYALYDTP